MAEQVQIISTSGVNQLYRPRRTYLRGNGGSVKEVWYQLIAELPEDHYRGETVTPVTWFGRAHGSIKPQEVTGTFDGSEEIGLTYPEEGPHVSPEIEEALFQSTLRKTFHAGGTEPPEGTFG